MEPLKQVAKSLLPLIGTSQTRALSAMKSADKVIFSTEKARLLLGQFRRGEANDPATFVTSVAAILSRYPDGIVLHVTDPRTGLASKGDWLPTIHEIVVECERLAEQEHRIKERARRDQETVSRRNNPPHKRPTKEEMLKKYGPGYGINQATERDHLERDARISGRSGEGTQRVILAEYDRLGLEPMWATDGVLLSPSLLSTLGRLRRPEVKNSIEEDQVENQSGGSEA